jgi:hypothetical protein
MFPNMNPCSACEDDGISIVDPKKCEVDAHATGYCLAKGFGYPVSNFNDVGNIECVPCLDYDEEVFDEEERKIRMLGWTEDEIEDYMDEYEEDFYYDHQDHLVPSNCLSECMKTAGQFAPVVPR